MPDRKNSSWPQICALLIGTVGFFLQAVTAVAQNIATNPGFETGNTSGWSPFGSPAFSASTAQVHSGTYACLVTNRTAAYMGISQSFSGTMQPNQPYTISIWMRLTAGASQTIQVTAQKIDGSGTTYSAIASGSVSSTAWTQLSGQYTLSVSGTLTNLMIYFEVPTSTNAAYFADDFLVQLANAPGTNGLCSVDWTNVFQRIDGFGASSAWQSVWTTTQGDMFFGTNNGTGLSKNGTNFSFSGVGLSLLRSRIVPGGTTVENSIMQMAQNRGARVWSSPWSPAATFKSNGNVNGGSFVGNAANYQAYASQLAGYVARMKTIYGINLYALSLQNEPDAQVTTYESCNWSAQQFHDFIPYLYNSLVASNAASTKIMLPESQNWTDPSNLVATAMSDSTSNYASIVANHNYVANNSTGDQSAPTAINSYGKALWETEVAILSGSDSSITNAVYWAGRIHTFLNNGQANAWHYWWLMPGSGAGNEALTDTNGVPAKRMYALGNFSRFVRPDFYRIGITTNTGSVLVSAYKDLVSSTFAIVAINSSPITVTQTFNLIHFNAVTNLTPWLTSGSQNLASQSVITVSNATFSYVLPGLSIATFVGQSPVPTNAPPILASVTNKTINAGATLALTNGATDADLPAQALTYTLLGAPASVTINATNGIITWRPPVAQANSTNTVITKVTDNGTPSLSATNSFSVIVNPLPPPTFSSITFSNPVNVLATGLVGPDYTLLASSNLANWQIIFMTNPVTMPVRFTDTNRGAAARFYRIQLGP